MKTLELTPTECQLVDNCLHGDLSLLHDLRPIILILARSVVDNKPATLRLDDEDLWLLRNLIDPHESVGLVSGQDIIHKLYRLFLGFSMPTMTSVIWNLPEQRQLTLFESETVVCKAQ